MCYNDLSLNLTNVKAPASAKSYFSDFKQRAADMLNDREYHEQRARAERDLAYRAPNARVGDVHLRLSALHLSRALVLEEVDCLMGETISPSRGSPFA